MNSNVKYKDFLQAAKEKPCPFCVTHPQEKIIENKTAYLTYALAPYHPDHLLTVPKRHIEHILDITDEELKDIDDLQKKGWEILKKLGYKSVSFIVREGDASGRTVTHIHYHVIPEVRLGDMDHNGDERKILSSEEVIALLARLRKSA
jgi:diadenosine tetraphosphate (Ap4A) HIT family hydrolase